jgi:hypothetical protein
LPRQRAHVRPDGPQHIERIDENTRHKPRARHEEKQHACRAASKAQKRQPPLGYGDAIGKSVTHRQFGNGAVTAIEGEKLTIGITVTDARR